MTVTNIFAGMEDFSVDGTGYSMSGSIQKADSGTINSSSCPALKKLLTACVLCNNASISASEPVNSRNRASVRSSSGLEHSIANMFYLTLAGAWGVEALRITLIALVGNAVGSWLINSANFVIKQRSDDSK